MSAWNIHHSGAFIEIERSTDHDAMLSLNVAQ